ncbi:MAG: HIT family protein [Methylibium sp.]|uniref:HIT family protein n=1 Tax=Methylibium sp. TaxID=2067992 RepID=UPI0017CFE3A3|nr:HIT family protein [Methylibium sp.]MBA3597217.1 HIT family protein [Methylibium sp.]
MGCELCTQPGGHLVHQTEDWRVVRVADAAFPAFYRLIWNRHTPEFTDLDVAARQRCMEAVAAVEQVLRAALQPTKINLASLGNVVAHLHWHVIARFDWDSHFPQPVWGNAQRGVEPPAAARLPLALETLDAQVGQALAALSSARD